jgi:hypothetical protein
MSNGLISKGIKLQSSSLLIESIQYSYLPVGEKRISEILTVVFVDGSKIEYLPPIKPPNEPKYNMELFYKDFIASYSRALFFHRHVKGQFQTKIITRGSNINNIT